MSFVTITIPSTGRPGRLADCLRSIDYCQKVINIGICFKEDLPEDTVLKMENVAVYISSDHPVRLQTALADLGPKDAHVLPISDDIVFKPGAIATAVQTLLTAFPDGDGVIGFNVTNMQGKDRCPYAYMLVGNKFFNDRLKRVLFPHEYRHFYADVELGEMAERLGRFRFCPEAGLIHFHPSAGYPADATHTRLRQEKWEHDHAVYGRRKNELSLAVGVL